MTFTCRAVILVVEVELETPPPWGEGPLPVGEGEMIADAGARRSYFNERSAQALYGPTRLHYFAEGALDPGHVELAVIGLELVAGELLVIHGSVGADGLELVESLARLVDLGAESPARHWCDGLLAGHGRVSASARRATALVQVTPEGELDRPLRSPDYEPWPPELQWLWLLASATPADAYSPPPEAGTGLSASVLHFSAGWRGLVLRDGAAFLGAGPDMGPIYRLSPDPELHFRSIYLDAFLLGMIQRLRLGEIADRLASLGDPVRQPERLAELEDEMAEFRNVFWWQQLGAQWHGNQLLRAYQRQHEIPELFSQVIGELEDYSRKAQTAATQRTEALLGVLTIVGLPFGLAVGILHTLGNDSWVWLLVSLAAAATLSGAILATGTGRTLLRLWRLLGPRPLRRTSRGRSR